MKSSLKKVKIPTGAVSNPDDGISNFDPELDSVIPNPSLVLGFEFETPINADRWFIRYGAKIGFDVRNYSTKRNEFGVLKSCIWVCSFEGFRAADKPGHYRVCRPTLEIRCGCQVRFRITQNRAPGIYRVTKFKPFHNHDLATGDKKKLLKCNRYINPGIKTLLSCMVESGIRQCDALNYIEKLEDGLGCLPFKRKDVYNHIAKQRSEYLVAGDVNTTLALLEGMKLKDSVWCTTTQLMSKKHSPSYFWTDGTSKAEYELFGDVLVFDSTYKTNTYHYPLVIFSGVNNHFQTCVFGAAFLFNESIESYCWLLQKFRETMCNTRIFDSMFV